MIRVLRAPPYYTGEGVLLSRHRQIQPLFRTDQVIVIIFARVELDPVDDAVEPARLGRVVG
jgi:hypothetical protein